MNQSKLYKAFERNKAERKQESTSLSSSVSDGLPPVKTQVKSERIITDVVHTETILARSASLKEMRNPNPMTISDMKKQKLIYSGMKNRAVLNAYRELRIKLIDQAESENLTVMISSVDATDNSAITAMNLAISFSLDVHSSALLVNCNPYGTDLQNLVTAKFDVGITDYMLDSDLSIESIIYPSGIEHVTVIPAGNNSASAVEQFSSQAMRNLIYELKNRYHDRFIVINAPPVLASSEARVLTRYCDQTVLTIPYGRADVNAIEDCVEALGASNVSGVVYQQ